MASFTSFGDFNQRFQANFVNGPVQNAFHAAPERPETPPNPSLVIPFHRDNDFIPRGTILNEIHQRCYEKQQRTALVGLGGIGKSQLAIEYAYRITDKLPGMWVFWVHASNVNHFADGFREIAERAKLAGRKDPNTNIYQLVHNWLCQSKVPWLLIIDNIDDAKFLLDPDAAVTSQSNGPPKLLKNYLPVCKQGSILFTSRDKDAVSELVEQVNIIDVNPMDTAEAVALLQKKLGTQTSKDLLHELASTLGGIPLALAQAAAFIHSRGPRCSVKQYLDMFNQDEENKSRLLQYDKRQLRRHPEAANSIMATWQISFKHIQEKRRTAADLLSLMSQFDPQNIPAEILRIRSRLVDVEIAAEMLRTRSKVVDPPDFWSANSGLTIIDGEQFEEDIQTLRAFHLISTSRDGTAFSMHAMVQLATNQWLQSKGSLEDWDHQHVLNLLVAIPTVAEYTDSELDGSTWNRCFACSFLGSASDAKMLIARAIETYSDLYGLNHDLTMKSMAGLTMVHLAQARFEDAKAVQLQVTEYVQKNKPNAFDLNMQCKDVLALCHMHLGDLTDAIDLSMETTTKYREERGPKSLGYLHSLVLLMALLQQTGQYTAAELGFKEVLEAYQELCGSSDIRTLMARAALATNYWCQKRYAEAVHMFSELQTEYQTTSGPTHHMTLEVTSLLAFAYDSIGLHSGAEELRAFVFNSNLEKHGPDDLNTLQSMNALACTLKDNDRHKDAIEMLEDFVQRSQRVLGSGHVCTSSFSQTLADWKAD